MTTIALNCMVLGDSPDFAFVVEIDPTKRIDHLKNIIKERRPDVFGNILAIHLTLWRVDIALDVPGEELSALQSGSYLCIKTTLGGEKLRSLQQIDKVFPVASCDEIVQVLVERPVLSEGMWFVFFFLIFDWFACPYVTLILHQINMIRR
jgi:Crinkler effector protein N-terminal domain